MSNTTDYYEIDTEDIVKRYENAEVSNLHTNLLNTFQPGSRLLEIGSGSGREASFLISNNYSVECLEKSGKMIDQSIKYHPELEGHISKCDVPKEFPDNMKYYDGVYAIASLMHLDIVNIKLTLEKIRINLKPGGILFFSVPLTRQDLDSTGFDSKNRFFLLLPPDEWIQILEEANFNNISTTTSSDGMGRKEINWLSCVAHKS